MKAILLILALILPVAASVTEPRQAGMARPLPALGVSVPGTTYGTPHDEAAMVYAGLRALSLWTEGSDPSTVAASRISGRASWFCGGGSACTKGYHPGDLIGAIDRHAGFHQGDLVRVRSGKRSVVVAIVDACGCPGSRVIDLSRAAFARLADPSRGTIPVTLTLVGGISTPATAKPVPTGPATDVGP